MGERREDVSLREIHDWRALTAYLLSKVTPDDTQRMSMEDIASSAASEVLDLLDPWAKPSQSEELKQQLADIYQDAIKLSCLLQEQRAHWKLSFLNECWSAGTLFYSSAHMEDIDTSSKSVASPDKMVEIVVEPALSKRGTMNGTKFEAGACVMMKAKVCLAPSVITRA